ncbi:MAG TPA: hypothetical protein VMT53_20840 [Terriglobales bacterium]|nr:hypothetical protein [Terriglobales bacterium]
MANASGEDSRRDRILDAITRVLLVVWVVFLVPWLIFAVLVGMAFDSSNKWAALFLVLSTWSYGPAVFGAFKLLKRSRIAVFVPFISIAGIFFFDRLASASR